MIYIHVGLHKTGTSFLQEEIFPKLLVNYIKPESGYDLLSFKPTSGINIISQENLSGTPYSLTEKSTRYEIASNLHKLYPHAKIIIGVRDLPSWFKSLYKHSIKMGNDTTFTYWLKHVDHSYYDTIAYLRFLRRTFDDVFVYNMNAFQKDKQRIIEDMCTFIGVECPEYIDRNINTSLTDYDVKLLRFINRFFASKHFHPNRLIPHTIISKLIHSLKKETSWN